MMACIRFCVIAIVILVLSKISHCSETNCHNVTKRSSNNIDSTPLYFGLMLSLSGDQQSTGALAGVQAALDDINSRDDLLPGYSLHYTLTDSQCNRTVALDGLFTQLFQPPQEKVALIGSGCSIATEATAEIAKYYNINHISCTSSLTEFIYHTNYFQLLPSEINLARVFHSIIKEYNWRKVALVVQNGPRFKTTINSLIKMLSKSKLVYSQLSVESILEQPTFDYGFRIYIVATSSNIARQLLCKAHMFGLKYPKYLFLTYGFYEPKWWISQYNDTDNDCSAEDVAEVLQFSLAVSHFSSPSRDKLYYYVCYDATYALAYALHNMVEDVDFNFIERTSWNAYNNVGLQCDTLIAKFCRNNDTMHSLLNDHLRSTNFTGISGPVHFDQNGIRGVTELKVLQYRTSYLNGSHVYNGEESLSDQLRLVPVAHFREDTERLEKGKNNLWPGVSTVAIPYDGVPSSEYVTIALPVTVTFTVLNIIGLTCAVICLLFNAIFHKKRLIRFDSPNLNYLIVIGSFGIYMSCITFVTPTLVPSAVSALCILRICLSTTGYTLMYGSVIAKLWRINKIFQSPKTAKKKQGIKDHHLLLIVLSLTLVDIVILVVYIAVEGVMTGFSVGTESNKENPRAFHGEQEMETVYMRYTCSTNTWIRTIAIGLIYLYKILLYICAFYYSFRLRKMKIKSLNDTKYIVAFVYTTSVLFVMTGISTLTLRQYINIYAVVYSCGFWLITSSILGFLFIPKMIRLYKDPEGKSMFTPNEKPVTLEVTIAQQEREDSSDVAVLKQRVKQLESELTKQNILLKDQHKIT